MRRYLAHVVVLTFLGLVMHALDVPWIARFVVALLVVGALTWLLSRKPGTSDTVRCSYCTLQIKERARFCDQCREAVHPACFRDHLRVYHPRRTGESGAGVDEA